MYISIVIYWVFLKIYENPLIYSQLESFPTHRVYIYIYIYILKENNLRKYEYRKSKMILSTDTYVYIYIYIYIYTWGHFGFSIVVFFLNRSLSNHIYIYIYIYSLWTLGVRVFANGPGDLGSIPGRVIPKTQKMVLDASLLNTQHYKVRIKGKVEQSRERISALPYTLV